MRHRRTEKRQIPGNKDTCRSEYTPSSRNSGNITKLIFGHRLEEAIKEKTGSEKLGKDGKR